MTNMDVPTARIPLIVSRDGFLASSRLESSRASGAVMNTTDDCPRQDSRRSDVDVRTVLNIGPPIPHASRAPASAATPSARSRETMRGIVCSLSRARG